MNDSAILNAEGELLWAEARALLAAYSEGSPDRLADLRRLHAEWQVRFARCWARPVAIAGVELVPHLRPLRPLPEG